MYEFGNNNDLKVDVFIKNSSGGEFASKLNGYFIVNNKSFRFSAIAFGRIGGHNINLKLSNLCNEYTLSFVCKCRILTFPKSIPCYNIIQPLQILQIIILSFSRL